MIIGDQRCKERESEIFSKGEREQIERKRENV